jgi:hypothetical protein
MKRNIFFRLLLIVAIGSFICVNLSFAQNWQALPPYNTLWPLWSPPLSPIDVATGLPTPLVSSLSSDTILPVMPGLTWDPAITYPWLLYNSPTGMLYFDPLLGIDNWPPKGFVHGSTPVQIPLPLGYSSLVPTPYSTLKTLVPLGNLAYINALTTFAPPGGGPAGTVIVPPTLTSLLSAAAIAGLGAPGAPMVIAPPVPPIPVVPPVPIPPVPPTPIAPIPPVPPIPIVPAPPVPPIPTAPVPTVTLPLPTAAISALSFFLPSTFGGGTTAIAPVITNWSGLWFSLLNSNELGPMSLSLSQNTVTGAVTGTASLILNKLLPLPVTVSGTFLGGTAFSLTGVFTDFQPALGGLFLIPIDYTLTLNCNLTSATTMSGNYTIVSIKENGIGTFNLNLL